MPPHRFVVVAMPRTGSWNLVETLDNHPEICCNGEILNPDDGSWGIPDPRTGLSPQELLKFGFSGRLLRRPKSTVRAVGFKVLEDQLRAPGSLQSVLQMLAACSDLRVLLLRRISLLDVLRSTLQAEATGRWLVRNGDEVPKPPAVHVDPEICACFFERCENYYRSARSTLADAALLDVTHGRMVNDRTAQLAEIQAHLGVTVRELCGPGLVRQEHRPLSLTIENFDELRAAFVGSRYAKYFVKQDTEDRPED